MKHKAKLFSVGTFLIFASLITRAQTNVITTTTIGSGMPTTPNGMTSGATNSSTNLDMNIPSSAAGTVSDMDFSRTTGSATVSPTQTPTTATAPMAPSATPMNPAPTTNGVMTNGAGSGPTNVGVPGSPSPAGNK